MNVIADVQFCKDARGKNIPKEVALLTLKDFYISHWIISPPYSVQKLTDGMRQQNNWLQKNCHGIAWTDGDVSQTRVKENLSEFLKNVGKIYVRGHEKATFLQDLTINEIINLEEREDCPSFEKLPWINTYCLYHAEKFCYLNLNCALNNAAKLKSWLLSSENEQCGAPSPCLSSTEPDGGSISVGYDPENVAETNGFYF